MKTIIMILKKNLGSQLFIAYKRLKFWCKQKEFAIEKTENISAEKQKLLHDYVIINNTPSRAV